MKTILIVTHNQFGYQLSSYYFSYYLKNNFKITYISFDEGRERVQLDGVQIYYVKKDNTFLTKSYIKFVKYIIKHIKQNNPSKTIIKYFPFCFFIPLISFQRIILDIRTASVSSSSIKNAIFNLFLIFETMFYNKLIILSSSLKSRLFLFRAIVVPLGAKPKGYSIKTFKEMKLLYVGTFNNRNIEKTIEGLSIFRRMYPTIKVTYTIIGDGKDNFKSKIKRHIASFNLEKYVILTGYVPHTRIAKYLKKSNVGVSFVPQTKYYDKQPPTKTFEYLLAGMPVLATSTSENRVVVNDKNGVLIGDNPESFANGLREIWINEGNWDSEYIADTVIEYTWENIVNTKLLPILRT